MKFIKVHITAIRPPVISGKEPVIEWKPQWRTGAIEISDISSMRAYCRSGITATRFVMKHGDDLYVKESVEEILQQIYPDDDTGLRGAL